MRYVVSLSTRYLSKWEPICDVNLSKVNDRDSQFYAWITALEASINNTEVGDTTEVGVAMNKHFTKRQSLISLNTIHRK